MRNLIRKNAREFFQKKKIIFLVLILGFLTLLAFFVQREGGMGEGKPFVRIGIVDLDDNKYTNLLVSMFQKNETFSKYAEIVEGDEKQCEEWFLSGEITAYVVIPKGFVQKMIYWEEGNEIRVRINGSYTLESVVMQNLLDGYKKSITAIEKNAVIFYDMLMKSGLDSNYIDKKNTEVSMAMIMKILNRENFYKFEEVSSVQKTNLLEYYYYDIIGILLLYGSIFVGMDLLLEREKKTLYRLKAAGVSMLTWLGSKVVFYGALEGIFLYVLFLLSRQTDFGMLLYDWIFSLFFLGMSVFLSSLCSRRQVYVMTANLCYFSFLLLGGGLLPTSYLPESLVNIGSFTPFYWYIKGRVTLSNSSGFLVLLLALTFVLLCFSGRCFQRTEVPDAE